MVAIVSAIVTSVVLMNAVIFVLNSVPFAPAPAILKYIGTVLCLQFTCIVALK